MKEMKIWICIYALTIVACLAGMFVLTREPPLPPGYHLETDGAKWSYIDADGMPELDKQGSRRAATREAWGWYRAEQRRKATPWIPQ